MNKISMLFMACLFAGVPAVAAQAWTPDPAMIQKLDTKIAAEPDFTSLRCARPDMAEFARYYWGHTDDAGHHFVIGQFLRVKDFHGLEPGIHLEPGQPMIADGGCSVVNLYYDVDGGKLSVSWGGR